MLLNAGAPFNKRLTENRLKMAWTQRKHSNGLPDAIYPLIDYQAFLRLELNAMALQLQGFL